VFPVHEVHCDKVGLLVDPAEHAAQKLEPSAATVPFLQLVHVEAPPIVEPLTMIEKILADSKRELVLRSAKGCSSKIQVKLCGPTSASGVVYVKSVLFFTEVVFHSMEAS
jgi:hypothetical protein